MQSRERALAGGISASLIILIGLLTALSGAASSNHPHPSDDGGGLPIHDGVGGEFSASSSLGREVSLSEFRDKVVLLFFGYTSCQDVCPATLAHLQSLVRELGNASNDVQVLFVTVDPENDSADHLKQYLARFDSRFVGLTGKPEEVDRIARLFMVKHDQSHGVEVSNEYSRGKTFTEHSYLYAHSQQIYLLDKSGRTRALFFTGSPLEEMQEAVTTLLNE
ncbi:MAG: SCO family protein [Deltaproteobacteria bacterium]|nr:SCO family protein [Deltaproteobacteria bacterium]MBW2715740.1 SCO family protein [Deltaproteobacteria bacterium]